MPSPFRRICQQGIGTVVVLCRSVSVSLYGALRGGLISHRRHEGGWFPGGRGRSRRRRFRRARCSRPRGVSRLCLLSEAGEQELVSDPVTGTQSQHYFPPVSERWSKMGNPGRQKGGGEVFFWGGGREITIVAEIPGYPTK